MPVSTAPYLVGRPHPPPAYTQHHYGMRGSACPLEQMIQAHRITQSRGGKREEEGRRGEGMVEGMEDGGREEN
eukprot:1007061-Pyramimonas_sp.AAC.1